MPRPSTKLARTVAARDAASAFFDLEWAADLQKLSQPELTLEPLRGLVVIDGRSRGQTLYGVPG